MRSASILSATRRMLLSCPCSDSMCSRRFMGCPFNKKSWGSAGPAPAWLRGRTFYGGLPYSCDIPDPSSHRITRLIPDARQFLSIQVHLCGSYSPPRDSLPIRLPMLLGVYVGAVSLSIVDAVLSCSPVLLGSCSSRVSYRHAANPSERPRTRTWMAPLGVLNKHAWWPHGFRGLSPLSPACLPFQQPLGECAVCLAAYRCASRVTVPRHGANNSVDGAPRESRPCLSVAPCLSRRFGTQHRRFKRSLRCSFGVFLSCGTISG